MKVAMPRYYSPTIKDYKITVKPKDKLRRFLYKFGITSPYFVGDKILLDIDVKKINTSTDELGTTLSICSKYPHFGTDEPIEEGVISVDGSFKEFRLIPNKEYQPRVEISEPGRVVIYLVETSGGTPYNILTADVYNDDNFNYFVVWPLVGIMIAFLGLILSVIALAVSLAVR
jgi:hypothetical protein